MTKQKQTIGRATTPVRRFRPKPLLGAWDAWNLLAASGAAVAALPLFAGNLSAAAAGLGLSALGGAGLAWPRVRDWLDPVDAEPREGFVLPSDPALADDGPLIGYTRDTNTPVRIPYDLFMHHLGLIGASGGGKTTLLLCVLPVSMQEMVFRPCWWNLFVRLANPHKHREAITSRPLLLHGVATKTQHGGQTTLTITSQHAKQATIQAVLTRLAAFLSTLKSTAEQLTDIERLALILKRAFAKFLRGRTYSAALLVPG